MDALLTRRNETDKVIFDRFVESVKTKDYAAVRQAIAEGGLNPHWAVDNADRKTPLMLAAASGDPAMVELLLSVSDPLAKDGNGRTALMLAAKTGSLPCLQALLAVSDPLATDAFNYTALMYASEGKHADCVKALIPVSNATVMTTPPDGDRGFDALMLAVISGSLPCVQALLSVSDPLARGRYAMTPLMLATRSPACLQALLAVSDPLLEDNGGLTALAHAARDGSVESLKILLPVSDPLALDYAGLTPLMHAEMSGSVDSVKIIEEHLSSLGLKKIAGKRAHSRESDGGLSRFFSKFPSRSPRG